MSGLAIALLVVCGPAAAQARLAAVVHLPDRLAAARAEVVDEALGRALARSGRGAVGPGRTFSLLAREARGKGSRRWAAEQLARAIVLIDRVRYREAVEILRVARFNAVVGLAQLVDPKLLSDIEFHLGTVKTVMRERGADPLLARSFALWPRRTIDSQGKSPKVLRAFRRAATKARTLPPPLPAAREMRRAARLAGVERLLLVTPLEQSPALEVVELRLFHRGVWTAPRQQVWPSSASADRIVERLERAVGELLGSGRGAGSPSRTRRTLAWASAGLAAALAGVGTALFVVSHRHVEEAESLAASPPEVEYADEAEGLERSARRMRTGAIVTLSLAGAAAVGAVVLWLTSPRGAGVRGAEGRAALRGAGVLVRF